MSHEVYGIIWYVLLATLWVGFIIFESFTSGVGMVFSQAKDEKEGRLLQFTVGPYWDGSEVWFITAGGATFAAFPLVYADVFSNLYVALYLLLIALIVRGVSMEMVYKDEHPLWQKYMSRAWTISSYLLALLLGVRFTNLFLKANTLEASSNSFFGLLSLPGILGGLLFITLYRTSGVLWANLKAKGDVIERVKKHTTATAIASAIITPILMMAFNWKSNLFTTNFSAAPILWFLPILLMIVPVITIVALIKNKEIMAFVFNTLSMALFMILGFVGLFPYMSPGITVYDGMASHLTLKIMTGVVIVFLPIVLGYQGWKFYRFRKKLTLAFFD